MPREEKPEEVNKEAVYATREIMIKLGFQELNIPADGHMEDIVSIYKIAKRAAGNSAVDPLHMTREIMKKLGFTEDYGIPSAENLEYIIGIYGIAERESSDFSMKKLKSGLNIIIGYPRAST